MVITDLTLQPVSLKLVALEQLNLCESEVRRMITDTIEIHGDYIVSDALQEEAEQLKCKLLALLVYYPQYFGYDPELMSNINEELYSQIDETENDGNDGG